MKELITYKFYDHKGRRLAIFGREIGGGNMEIFILTCSKKDMFCKETAREVWNSYLGDFINMYDVHPETVIIPCGFTPNRCFFNYCKTNFLKEYEGYALVKIKYLA